jgi:hypothetical protein
MKHLLENWRKYMFEGRMPEGFLYHGTSSKQYELIKNSGYAVENFYLTEDEDKSADYAEKQSIHDGSEGSVILKMDASKLAGDINMDRGSSPEEWEHDMGQWVYTGNIENAIVGEERW